MVPCICRSDAAVLRTGIQGLHVIYPHSDLFREEFISFQSRSLASLFVVLRMCYVCFHRLVGQRFFNVKEDVGVFL